MRGAETPYGPGPPSMAGGYRRVSGLRRPARAGARAATPSGPAPGSAEAEALRPRRRCRGELRGGRRAGLDEAQAVPQPVVGEAAALEPPLDGDVARQPVALRRGDRSSAVPPGATRHAMPAAAASSRASAPRSSEPHGRLTVTRSATPCRSAGRDSAAAATNSAFGRPPFRAGAAARRDASTRASATGSMPITSRVGFAAAVARTNRPSPVPRSASTPSYAAARAAS